MPAFTKKVASEGRKVAHPKVRTELHLPDDPITVQLAEKLLGWTEEGAEKFGSDYTLLIDGKKIRLANNMMNRPIYDNVLETLTQVILQKQWEYNGEPVIIGKTGQILNGQHTLISVKLAEFERTGKQKNHWEVNWPTPITIAKIIVYGIDESDKVVNTMDTCKPRSLADVIYRSQYFKKMKPGERRIVARMCDHAVKMLWHRTGASKDAFAPRRTHMEAMEFIERHDRVMRAVRHVHTEYKSQWEQHNKRFSAGYASALLYLMGSSDTNPDDYHSLRVSGGDQVPSEKVMDWSEWDKACDFWSMLCKGDSKVVKVRMALGGLGSADGKTSGTLAEKIAIITKAWIVFRKGQVIDNTDLVLDYAEKDDIKVLINVPTFDGIDLGNPKEQSVERGPTPEEIAEAAKKERQAKADKLLANRANLKNGRTRKGKAQQQAAIDESEASEAEDAAFNEEEADYEDNE